MFDSNPASSYYTPADDFHVDQEVESVKRLVSNFLGLLHDSIEEDSSSTIPDPVRMCVPHSNSPEKKLSTILSASQQSSGRPIEATQSKSQPYEDTQRYQQYFGSSSIEQKFVGAFIALTTDKAIKQESPSLSSSSSSAVSQCQSQVKNCEKSKSQSSVRPTMMHSEVHKQPSEADLNSSVRILDYQGLIREVAAVLGPKNIGMSDRLRAMVKDFNSYIGLLQERNSEILVKSEKYRVRSEHLLKAVETIRDTEKKLVDKYVAMRDDLQHMESVAKDKTDLSEKLYKDLEIMKSQNVYLKDLIMLANKNYQSLEKKMTEVESRAKKAENTLKQKEMEMLQGNGALKDALLKLGKENMGRVKISSPLRERSQQNKLGGTVHNNNGKNMGNTHGRAEIQDTYRKMFLKTLKTVKR